MSVSIRLFKDLDEINQPPSLKFLQLRDYT
jgi:hypothetical protein